MYKSSFYGLGKIINLEKDPVASVSREEEIDALKKEKLALKDELFKILEAQPK